MTSPDWEQMFAVGHISAASGGLFLGAVVLLLLPKGQRAHRIVGAVYVGALVLVNVAALSLHREDVFGIFHALAVVSLGTVAAGIVPMLLGARSEVVIATHAYCMAWSYAGLVAAGCGQLVVPLGPGWAVPAAIGVVLAISAVLIFTRVPSSVDRALRARRRVPAQ